MDHDTMARPSPVPAAGEPAGADVRDRDRTPTGLQTLLRDPSQLEIHFQPIVATRGGCVIGVEALSRFPDGRPPDVWFSEAADLGLGTALEIVALERAIEEAALVPPDVYVAVNVSPARIVDRRLRDVAQLATRDLVLELTQHVPVEDWDELRAATGCLREAGVRVAADDAGDGYAGLAHVLNLRPDCIKLDRALVRGIDNDLAKRTMASAFADFAREIGAFVVAEGVETEAELEAVVAAGVRFVQGYLFGPPGPVSASLQAAFTVHAPPRALVVDDDSIVRAVVTSTLDASGFEVVGGARDGAEAVALARSCQPDVITLDLAMPSMDGREALPLLRAAVPGAIIVVLSGSEPGPTLARLIDAYVNKDHAVQGLPGVIRDLVRGRHVA